MKFFGGLLSIIVVLGAGFFLFSSTHDVKIIAAVPGSKRPPELASGAALAVSAVPLPSGSVAAAATATPLQVSRGVAQDIEAPGGLKDPPTVIHGIYITNWTAGSAARASSTIRLIKKLNLNAVVVDIKDYSGYMGYRTDIPAVAESGAENDIRIKTPNALLKRFHDEGIYVIGRITVFQDPVLAKTRPTWALTNASSGLPWRDRKGLRWLDPASKDVWDYNIAIAKDALRRGFDEVNFDYIRFPSDGDLESIKYPYWDGRTSRHQTIARFFKYVREALPGAKTSVDIFGLTTMAKDDLGIGQVIEDAYRYFDYVSPMVYPSHFAPGSMGYKNPAKYPYEVVKTSMTSALDRLDTLKAKLASSTTPVAVPAKLRPWLQSFDLGAVYDAAMIEKQIQASEEVLGESANEHNNGWLLWDPSNTYHSLL